MSAFGSRLFFPNGSNFATTRPPKGMILAFGFNALTRWTFKAYSTAHVQKLVPKIAEANIFPHIVFARPTNRTPVPHTCVNVWTIFLVFTSFRYEVFIQSVPLSVFACDIRRSDCMRCSGIAAISSRIDSMASCISPVRSRSSTIATLWLRGTILPCLHGFRQPRVALTRPCVACESHCLRAELMRVKMGPSALRHTGHVPCFFKWPSGRALPTSTLSSSWATNTDGQTPLTSLSVLFFSFILLPFL